MLATPKTPRHNAPKRPGLSSQNIWAVYQDFEIEAATHLKHLAMSEAKRLQLFDDYCKDKIDKLDKRVKNMKVQELVDEYGYSTSLALKDTIMLMLRPVEELSPKERKRYEALYESRRTNAEGSESAVGPKRRTRNNATKATPATKILKNATREDYKQQLGARAREMKITWVKEMEHVLSESGLSVEEKGNLMLEFFDFRQF